MARMVSAGGVLNNAGGSSADKIERRFALHLELRVHRPPRPRDGVGSRRILRDRVCHKRVAQRAIKDASVERVKVQADEREDDGEVQSCGC